MRGTGDFARAAECLREAEALLAADPKTAPSQYAVLDQHLAQLALARGDASAAVELAERGLTRQPRWEALALQLVLAEANNERGDFGSARAAAERAQAFLDEWLGDRGQTSHAGRCRLERGIALAGQGNRDAAREELRQAIEHLGASLGPDAPATKRARAYVERVG